MSSSLFTVALSLSLVVAISACRPRTTPADSQLQSNGAASTASSNSVIADRVAFYDSTKSYWLYVDGWGQEAAKGWNASWSRLQFGLVPKNSTVSGARATLIETTGQDKTHCDSARGASPLLSTDTFRVSAMGNKTRFAAKGNLLVQFTNPADRVGGIEYLHLVGLVNDATYMREGLAYDLIRESGSPSALWTWVKVCVDGIYYGEFFAHERSDDTYYRRQLDANPPETFYEGAWMDNGPADMAWRGDKTALYADRGYELKGPANADSFKDLVTLIRVLNGVGEKVPAYFATEDYAKAVEKVFDADHFLRWAAAARLLGAWDNYMQNANNFFLANFGQSDASTPADKIARPYFRFIPVDFDNVFGQRFVTPADNIADVDWAVAPLFNWEAEVRPAGSKRPMISNLLQNPRFRRVYGETLRRLVDGPFQPDAVKARRDSLWQVIEKGVYAEADTEHCDTKKSAPFQCAHTGRSVSNHSAWRWTHLEKAEDGGRDFVYKYDGGGSMRAEGIVSFVTRRFASAKAELKAEGF